MHYIAFFGTVTVRGAAVAMPRPGVGQDQKGGRDARLMKAPPGYAAHGLI